MKPVEVEILLKGNLGSGMQQATAQTQGLDQAMRRLGMTIGGVFSAAKVMEFGRAVIDVRSKIETLQTSFQVLLGDKGKADALFGSIKEFAATTPMLMDDLASGAQTMLGFGIESEKVMGYLKALGDISMGDSQRFQSLTLAFSQMSATGKLMGQDLLQMINAGFNPLKVISEQTGKSIGTLKDEMSQGAISAEDVQKAFLAAAGSGGQFEGMLDKLSKTQAGALSNLQGAWDDFLNAVGEQTEGVVVSAATGLTDLLHHYRELIGVIKGVVVAYGAYKGALMAVVALQKASALIDSIRLVGMFRKELGLLTAAQQAFNVAGKAHPLLAIGSAIIGVITLVKSLSKSTEESAEAERQNAEATEEVNKENTLAGQIQKQSADEATKHKMAIEQLTKTLHDNEVKINDRREALVKLKKIVPGYHAQLTKTGQLLNDNTSAIDKYVKGIEKMALAEALYDKMVEEMKKSTDARMAKQVFEKQIEESHKHDGEAIQGDGYYYSGEAVQHQREVYRAGIQREIDKQDAIINKVDENVATIKSLYQDDDELAKMVNDKIASNGASGKLVNPDELSGEDLSGNGSKKTGETAAERAARETAQRAENLKEEQLEWDAKLAQERNNAYYAQEEARIAAITNSAEREREERRLQHRKDLDQVDQQEQEFRRQNYEHNKKVFENSAKGNKNKYTGTVAGTALTDDQQAQIDARRKKIEAEWQQYQAEQLKKQADAEQDALNSYLEQYGTAQEQKYAIAQEYARKIADLDKEGGSDEEKRWRRKSLTAERDAKLSQADAQSLSMGIDWGVAFEGVGNVLGDIARETLAKVDEYMKSAEFRRLPAESKKAYADFRGKLQQETGGPSESPFNFKQWDEIAQLTRQYQDSVRTLAQRTEEHNLSVIQLEQAQKELKNATTADAKAMAKAKVDLLKRRVETTGQQVDEEKGNTEQVQQDLTQATQKATNGLQNFASYVSEMSNGSLYGFANGVTKLITSLQKGSDGIGKSLGELGGKVGGIIGAILQIIDALGDDPKGFIDDLFNKIADAIDRILSDLPELIGTVVQGVGKLLGSVGNGLMSMVGLSSSNEKEKQAEIDRLTEANKELAKSIDELKETISDGDSTNKESVEAYRKAVEAQKEREENMADIVNAQARKSKSGIGGHRSFAHNANERQSLWLDAFNAVLAEFKTGKVLKGADDFFHLTPSEMKLLKEYAPEAWSNFMQTKGYKHPGDLMDEYMEMAGEADELTDALNEKLTGYSWDSFRDGYTSLIEDMTSTTDDFGDHIEEVLSNAILSSLVTEKYREKIKALYDYIAEAAEDGEFTAEEVARIRAMNSEIANGMTADRQQLVDLGVIKDTSSNTQSGKSGTFTTMTQDQGTKLEGLFTNNLRHLASIDGQLPSMAQQMTMAESHLARIAENSEYLRRLETIADDVARMRRDGVKAV